MSAGEISQDAALEAAEHIRRYNVWKGVYDAASADMLHLDGLVSGYQGDSAVINMPGQKYPSVVIQSVRSDNQAGDRLLVTERRIEPKGPSNALFSRSIVLYRGSTTPNTIVTWQRVAGRHLKLLDLIEQDAGASETDELLRLDSIFAEIDEARRTAAGKRAAQVVEAGRREPLTHRLGDLIKRYTR